MAPSSHLFTASDFLWMAVMFRALTTLLISLLVATPGDAVAAPASHEVSQWTRLARQVGQSETSRSAALRALRDIKDLNPTFLQKALDGPHRALALDVISALELRQLIPDLLNRVSSDEDGFLVLAINSLLDEEHKDLVIKSYLERLDPSRPQIYSPAALVAMLEPLGRLGIPLSKETVGHLLEHEYPEVRSAALLYVRSQILNFNSRDYSALVVKALNSSPLQLRLQAMYLIDEMAKKPTTKSLLDLDTIAAACQKEKGSVKDWCAGVVKKAKSPQSNSEAKP